MAKKIDGNDAAKDLYGDGIDKDDINKHQKNELSEKGSKDWLGRENPKTGKSPLEELEDLKEEIEDDEDEEDDDRG